MLVIKVFYYFFVNLGDKYSRPTILDKTGKLKWVMNTCIQRKKSHTVYVM